MKQEEIKLENKLNDNSEFFLKPLSKWSQAITLTLISLASFGFIFAFFTRIEEVVTSRGDLESTITVQKIYPPLGGYISKVLVKEGQLVEKYQPLITIDSDSTIKTKDIINDQLKNETERYLAELNIIKLKKESLEESKKNQELIIPKLDKLLKEGAISRLEFLDKKEEYFNTKMQIAQKEYEITTLKKSSFKVINEYKKELEKINKTLKYQNIKSSIKGKVFDLKATKAGFFVRENDVEPIMKIVPIDNLTAKIFISNKDIGFIKKGQLAKIRIDSYPFTEFGEINGFLESIANEVIYLDESNIPYYSAIVRLDSQFLVKNDKKFPLISGQTIQVNLITRNKRVISLFTDTINKSIDSLKSIRMKEN